MPKTIVITLNNSGNDPGPYTLSLIDSLNVTTPWSGNPVTKAQVTAGYQMTVPDNIVKVKVQSQTCTTFVELTIPTTQCPCRTFDFCGVKGPLTTFTFYRCGQTTPTTITVGDICVSQCVDTYKPITKVGDGSYTDTSVCCTGS